MDVIDMPLEYWKFTFSPIVFEELSNINITGIPVISWKQKKKCSFHKKTLIWTFWRKEFLNAEIPESNKSGSSPHGESVQSCLHFSALCSFSSFKSGSPANRVRLPQLPSHTGRVLQWSLSSCYFLPSSRAQLDCFSLSTSSWVDPNETLFHLLSIFCGVWEIQNMRQNRKIHFPPEKLEVDSKFKLSLFWACVTLSSPEVLE